MKKIIKIIIKFTIWVCLISIIGLFLINSYVVTVGKKYLKTIDTVSKSQCILVFGAAVSGNKVSESLGKRLDTAYELYKMGKSRKIIVSGTHVEDDYNEVKAMKNYLVKKGVDPEDISMDDLGLQTSDSVNRAKEIYNVSSVILVSQREHLIRALYMAEKIGIKCEGVPCKDYGKKEFTYQQSREFLARMKAFIDYDLKYKK